MILDRFRLDDRVAIVTGAGQGIGRGIAIGLAEAGADVVLAARTESDLDEVAAQVHRVGRRALVVPRCCPAQTVPGTDSAPAGPTGRSSWSSLTSQRAHTGRDDQERRP